MPGTPTMRDDHCELASSEASPHSRSYRHMLAQNALRFGNRAKNVIK
jgi:hypothetical protein